VEVVLLDARQVTFEVVRSELGGELRRGVEKLGRRHQGEQPGRLVPSGSPYVTLDVEDRRRQRVVHVVQHAGGRWLELGSSAKGSAEMASLSVLTLTNVIEVVTPTVS